MNIRFLKFSDLNISLSSFMRRSLAIGDPNVTPYNRCIIIVVVIDKNGIDNIDSTFE